MVFKKFTLAVLAVLATLALIACSDDAKPNAVLPENPDNPQGGVELGGTYALTGRIGDVYPKMLIAGGESGGVNPQGSAEEAGFGMKGTVVVIVELDSLTFERTGRIFADTLDNDEGRFSFEDVSLHSPFVLIENQRVFRSSTCYTCVDYVGWDSVYTVVADSVDTVFIDMLRAMVDLRKIQNISINMLTDEKVPVLQKYLAEGMSYETANEKAESDILENYGVYHEVGDFEEASDENSEVAYVKKLRRIMEFGAVREFVDNYVRELQNAPVSLFVGKGPEVEAYYWNAKKMAEYEVGYLAKEDSLGRCTETRENEMGFVKGNYGKPHSVICRSGRWTLGVKKMDYTLDSITDARDGKTYKTVTYNVGETSQTWMAENLNYLDTTQSEYAFCWNDDPQCQKYGRFYTWFSAMNIGVDDFKFYALDTLGDTVTLDMECLYARIKECPEDDYDCKNEMNRVEEECSLRYDPFGPLDWTYGYVEYVSKFDTHDYQGVCPDGWRIPLISDWKKLLEMMGEQYGVPPEKALSVLYDDEATGFGIKTVAKIEFYDDETNEIWIEADGWRKDLAVADGEYFSVIFLENDEDYTNPLEKMVLEPNENNTYFAAADPYYAVNVRCIKK